MEEAYSQQYREEDSTVLQAIAGDPSFPFTARRAAAALLAARGERSDHPPPPWDLSAGRAPSWVRWTVAAVAFGSVLSLGMALLPPPPPSADAACSQLVDALRHTDVAFAAGLEPGACRFAPGGPPPTLAVLELEVCGTLGPRVPAAWRALLAAGSAGEEPATGGEGVPTAASGRAARGCVTLPLGRVVQEKGRPWLVVLEMPR